MPIWAEAGLWGLLAGSALVLGAAIAWFRNISTQVTASVMAFGAGVLISAMCFDLVDEAADFGGLRPTALGLLAGASTYVAVNLWLAGRGAAHRKRSDDMAVSEAEHPGSGTAIAVGALLDGVPESVALGVTLLGGGGVSLAVLAAIFISNLPEGLASTAGMKRSGRSARYVFGVWGGIAVASGVAAMFGSLALADASGRTLAWINSIAAGAILAMIADTMIPEAFRESASRYQLFTGLIATLGFITAFAISHST